MFTEKRDMIDYESTVREVYYGFSYILTEYHTDSATHFVRIFLKRAGHV